MKKILVVADDFITLSEIKVHLEQEGYEVETARNGKDALLMLDSFRADIIIVDLIMPDMRGDQLINILWGRYPQLPVILIGNIIPDEHHADRAITKPINFDVLNHTIKELLPE